VSAAPKNIPGWHKDYSALAECFGALLLHRLPAVSPFFGVPVPQRMIREQMRVGMVITDAMASSWI